jgi:hypothetical protein
MWVTLAFFFPFLKEVFLSIALAFLLWQGCENPTKSKKTLIGSQKRKEKMLYFFLPYLIAKFG